MKGFEVFLVFALIGVCVCANLEDGLKVKFDVGLHPESGDKFFHHIPLNKSAAIENNWELTERPKGHLPSLMLYCKDEDHHMCIFYDDDTGYVAGLQICMPEEEFTDKIFDWGIQGFTKWTPPTKEGKAISYQCKSQFYVSQKQLEKSVEERLASGPANKILKEDKIWLEGYNGELDEWPTKTSELEKTQWTKQGCLMWMGQHYYYDMSKETLCKADKLYSWFFLVDSGEIVGIGFIAFGKLPTNENRTDWFERPGKLAVKIIVPDGPECLYDLADNPGLVTMHTYFVNNPWGIGCSIFG